MSLSPFSANGNDSASSTQLVVTPANITVNEGQPLQSVVITGFSGHYNSPTGSDGCWATGGSDWFSFNLNITGGTSNGTTLQDICSDSIIGLTVTDFTNITVSTNDTDNYSDMVYFFLTLEVTYETPSCPAPSALTASNITINSADLSWISDGNTFDIKWGLSGFDFETEGLLVEGFANGGTLSGLAHTTAYQYYVRQDCGGGDISSWSGPYTFTTLAAPASIPWLEPFAGTTFPANWSNISSWTVGASTTIAPGAEGSYLYKNIWGTTGTNGAMFSTLRMGLVSAGDILNFNYGLRKSSTTYTASGTISIEVSTDNGVTYSPFQTITHSDDVAWTSSEQFDLSAYAGENIRIRITATRAGTSDDYYLAFDNFYVGQPITCEAPTALTASNPTLTSIDLSWDGVGGASGNYEIKWGAPGFDIDAATAIPVAGLTHTLVGTGGSYEFVVREICDINDESSWSAPYSFSIPNLGEDCSAPIVIGALPYTTTDDTANYTDNPNIEGSPGASGCGITSNYLNGNDVVYAYTAAFDGLIQVKMTPTGTYSGIFAYASCNDIGTACIGGASNSGSAVNMFELNVANGETYYFVISTWASPQTVGYTLDISQVLCAKPTGVDHADVTHNSANVSWDVLGNYEINWGTGTFTAGDGDNTDTVNNTTEFAFSGLNGTTTYRYFVRQNCGGTDGDSEWVGPFTFTTLLAPASIPWLEGFTTTTIPTGWAQTGFSFGAPAGITNAPGGVEGNVIYKNLYGTGSNASGNFQTINMGLVSSGDILSFIHRVSNYSSPYAPPAIDSGNFIVAISTDNGVNYTNIQTITNDGVSEGWQDFEYDLSSYEGEYVRIRISATRTAGDYYLAFDNFYVGQPITCVSPTALTATNITTNTADLSWTSEGSTFDISWGTGAFDAEDGTIVSLANGGTLSGLAPQTAYQYYVRQNCGIGDFSLWAGPVSFTTACTSLSEFSENFESTTGSSLPNCWAKVGTTGTTNTQASTKLSGARVLYVYDNVTIALPVVDNASAGTHQMVMDVVGNFSTGATINFGYLTNPTDASSFVTISSIVTNSSTVPQEFTTIPSGMPAGDVVFAIYAPGVTSSLIDNVRWEAIPSCLPPTALVNTDVTTTTADISWTAGDSETSWNVSWGTPGYTPDDSNEISNVSVSSISYQITGLAAYTAYDVYVRANCGVGDESTWVGPLAIFTGYCQPTTTNNSGHIASFTADGGAAQSISNLNTGSGLTGTGYSNFSAQAVEVAAGGEINYVVTIESGQTAGLKIWVDWDNNMMFDQPSEVVYMSAGYSAGFTGSFTIPANASGTYRMRIGSSYTPNSGPANACTHSGQGEYEDYTISIVSACSAEWTGTVSTDWNTAGNWCDNAVPTAGSDVVINVANPVIISTDVTVNSITLGSDASLTVNETLTVGDISVAVGGGFTVTYGAGLLQPETAVNTGDITVKVEAGTEWFGYNMFSSSVVGQSFSGFSPNNGGGVYTYFYNDATNHGYTLASGSEFVQGLGYLFSAPYDGFPLGELTTFYGEFTGVPNNGDVLVSVNADTYAALGNPYPSAIDAVDFLAANSHIGTLYFWTNANFYDYDNSEYPGYNYATYTSLAGTGTSGDVTYEAPNGTIAVGQGFVAAVTGAGPVAFDNAMRIDASGTLYKALAQDKHRMWLNLNNSTNMLNQIVIGYMEGASMGVDNGIDGPMFDYDGSSLYSLIENSDVNYTIQGRYPFATSDVVPLGFKATTTDNYTISLVDFDGLFAEGQDIYLLDHFTTSLVNLKDTDYSFVSEPGVFDTRFEIVYNSTMSISNPTLDNSWVVYKQNGHLQILAEGFDMKQVVVIDMLGRTIYQATAEGRTHQLPELGANAVLIIKVISTDNQTSTKKVVH